MKNTSVTLVVNIVILFACSERDRDCNYIYATDCDCKLRYFVSWILFDKYLNGSGISLPIEIQLKPIDFSDFFMYVPLLMGIFTIYFYLVEMRSQENRHKRFPNKSCYALPSSGKCRPPLSIASPYYFMISFFARILPLSERQHYYNLLHR